MNTIVQSSGLYYPSIDVPNEAWLRSSCLFWDSISTIVPDSVSSPYTSQFAQELRDEGFLRPLRVNSDMDEVEDLSEKLIDYITNPATSEFLYSDNNTNVLFPNPSTRQWVDLHPEKLPYFIREEIEKISTNRDWYKVNQGFASYYMTLLASSLSERMGLSLLTDSKKADSLSLSLKQPLSPSPQRPKRFGEYRAHSERRTLPSSTSKSLLIDVMMQGMHIPNDISVKELMKFKNDHYEELASLRKELSKLTSNIPNDIPLDALKQIIQDQYNHSVKPAVKSLKNSIQAQGWDTLTQGLLKISCLSAAPASLMVVGGIPIAIALLACAGITITGTVLTMLNSKNKLIQDSPYSYLISVENKFR